MKSKGGKSIKNEFSYNSKENKIFLNVKQIKKLIKSWDKFMRGVIVELKFKVNNVLRKIEILNNVFCHTVGKI